MKDHSGATPQRSLEAEHGSADTVAPHDEPFQCAMCEHTFVDDEIIRVVEGRLVCEDCCSDRS